MGFPAPVRWYIGVSLSIPAAVSGQCAEIAAVVVENVAHIHAQHRNTRISTAAVVGAEAAETVLLAEIYAAVYLADAIAVVIGPLRENIPLSRQLGCGTRGYRQLVLCTGVKPARGRVGRCGRVDRKMLRLIRSS